MKLNILMPRNKDGWMDWIKVLSYMTLVVCYYSENGGKIPNPSQKFNYLFQEALEQYENMNIIQKQSKIKFIQKKS